MYGRILGLSPQAGSNRVGSNTIDLPENDFCLFAAIGRVLRQFSAASRLECVPMTSEGGFPHPVTLVEDCGTTGQITAIKA
jgi:hypothetical protein